MSESAPRGIQWIRKVGEPSDHFPVGFLVPLVGGSSVPDGWQLVPDGEGLFVGGVVAPDVEYERAFAITERFLAGESVSELATAFELPVATIEAAVRWFTSLED